MFCSFFPLHNQYHTVCDFAIQKSTAYTHILFDKENLESEPLFKRIRLALYDLIPNLLNLQYKMSVNMEKDIVLLWKSYFLFMWNISTKKDFTDFRQSLPSLFSHLWLISGLEEFMWVRQQHFLESVSTSDSVSVLMQIIFLGKKPSMLMKNLKLYILISISYLRDHLYSLSQSYLFGVKVVVFCGFSGFFWSYHSTPGLPFHAYIFAC